MMKMKISRTKRIDNVWMVAFRHNDRFFLQTFCAAQRNTNAISQKTLEQKE